MHRMIVLDVIVALAVLTAAVAMPAPAAAWSSCGSSYYVQWGDTLGKIAARCGTSVAALRQANPNLGYWLYAGQTLWMPGGTTYGHDGHDGYARQPSCSDGTYVVQSGDTMRKIADRYGVTVGDMTLANPQIWNPSLIYAGQVICLAHASTWYTIQWGDSLRSIAARYGTTTAHLIAMNPQLWNPNLIYPGQVIRLW